MSVLLDASAILAVLQNEPGDRTIIELIATEGGTASSVNLAEVVAKLCDNGLDAVDAEGAVNDLPIFAAPFTRDMASLSGALRPLTRQLGLSLGDRSCIATARVLRMPVLTTDRAWAGLDVGVDIRIVR
ncbi:MAG: type II toxin-antitoxin system VapC family toxin [Thermoleophilia bacterium]|nr:type II toxin-antitoxin system VapC family toxin [Thermoleophilia bacterium]